jgi:hypothetical protein
MKTFVIHEIKIKLLPAEVTELSSKYWGTTTGEEGTCEELMRYEMWNIGKQNMGTKPQNVIHAINFHANNMHD